MKKQIAVALSGGGAKGYAHLGALSVLEEEGYDIVAVSGTSIGSLVGALYAAGYTPSQILSLLQSVDPRHLFDRRRGDRPSILGLQGIETTLRAALGQRTFADLPRPFGAVALDILSTHTIFLRSGSVVEAVLASSAIPGMFPPVKKGNWLLVDGGLADNVPVRLARLLAPRVPVVAVSLGLMPPAVHCFSDIPLPLRVPLMQRAISRLRYTQAFNTFVRASEIALGYATTLRLEVDRPEVLVVPAVHDVEVLGTPPDAERVVAAGEAAMREALPALRRVSRRPRWLRRTPPVDLRYVIVDDDS